MKSKVKADLWVKVLLWGIIFMFVPLFFFVPTDELYILALSTIILAVIIIPLFKSYYELTDDEVVIHIFGYKKRIKYENIKSLRVCENWLSSSAMSKERIEIVEHHKKKIMGTTYISPIDREQFFKNLKASCRNLDYVPEEHNLNAWEE